MSILTQQESVSGFSGSGMAIYSFLVHTATTSTPSMVKKASSPVPLAVKKLNREKSNLLCCYQYISLSQYGRYSHNIFNTVSLFQLSSQQVQYLVPSLSLFAVVPVKLFPAWSFAHGVLCHLTKVG